MSSSSTDNLVALRIDATSHDSNVRIIDTILLDPNCFPIPLLPPLHESVEQNAKEMANTIISDAEVIGMGRTVRHFTNRVDLWSPSLQEIVEEQLRKQMWNIVQGKRRVPKSTIVKISLRLTVNNIIIRDDFDWDTSLPTCPIQFAESMAKDLNLPSEATVAIATSIVEQLNGSVISAGTPSTASTAHLVESRADAVANLAHAVALQRPPTLDRRVI